MRNLSLSRKIALGTIPLFLLFVAVSVILQNHFQEKEMIAQAQETALIYAEIIKESMVSMMINNLEVDESFLERVNNLEQIDTLHILVNELRLRKEVVPPEKFGRVATAHKTLLPHDDIEREVLETGTLFFGRTGDKVRGVIPFTATSVCQECHAVPIGYTLGAADIHISFAQVSVAAEGNWRRSLIIFLAFSGLAIVVGTIGFRRVISGRIQRLIEAANELKKGNLEHAVNVGDPGGRKKGQDEIQYLATRFEEMRVSLKEKIAQLDEANANLSQRNMELEATLAQLQSAQEELIKMERLAVTGRMTAQLSHEINNPVHNIQSLLETSLRKPIPDKQVRELISVALEEVNRMATLTRQILDVYRGSMIIVEREAINVREILHDIIGQNESALREADIVLRCEVPDSSLAILSSRDKMKQIYLNLLLNARDAMPLGGTITLRARERNGYIDLEVSDEGEGIPPEKQSKIFDAFYTTKDEARGVGLGLFVTYGLVQQLKGTIAVRSAPGAGTTFTIAMEKANDSGTD